MKVSCITNGVSNDYEQACKIMNETGVKYAEIQLHNGSRIETCTIADAKEIKRLSDQYNIQPVCVTTHAFVGIPVGNIEVGDSNYQHQMSLLENGIAIARILGINKVRCMCFAKQIVTFGGHGGDSWCAGGCTAWPKFIELFRPIVECAAKEKVEIVVENGFNGMISSARLFDKFYNDLGRPGNIKFLWDPANALYYGEVPDKNTYECVKDTCTHVHIKDVHVDSVNSCVDVRHIGRGDMAPYLLEMAEALRANKYDGYVSLENIYRPDGGDFVDGYRLDIPVLKEIFED